MEEHVKQHFMEMEMLFNQPGWRKLVDGWKEERDALYEAAFWNSKSFEDVLLARERWHMLNQLIELRETIDEQKAAAERIEDVETDSI